MLKSDGEYFPLRASELLNTSIYVPRKGKFLMIGKRSLSFRYSKERLMKVTAIIT